MTHTTATAARHLPLRYRIGWRLHYLALSAYGPAELGGVGQPDPRRQMREERSHREAALAAPVPRGALDGRRPGD